MMDDEKQPPIIDLHESEWKREGKHEPFWGPNAKSFAIMIPLYIASFLIAKTVVEALWPLLWPQ